MKKSVIGWILAAVLAVGGAAFAYLFWFAGGSGEPSTELTTPPLADATTTTSSPSDTTAAGSDTTTGGSGAVAFVIDPGQSIARFELDEVLRGEDTHVVGTTDQVAGQVQVDPSDLAGVEFSDIIVNARTFTTGAEQRDRAIRGPVILDSASDANELITFSVISVDGLSGELSSGETAEFTITGDLTVKGTTQPVTFDATVTMVNERTIEGSAVAEVTRDMFEIGIPSVPSVADVTNEVVIALDFVAVAG
jgi:polyisoprenoid-binding protein YceI